ncbi:MAG TPA: hypothetical protein VLD84_08795 [Nitrososphaeraceae archaeon]|nr:hypothetical protein [Nitrososphaeraceae archaeon]
MFKSNNSDQNDSKSVDDIEKLINENSSEHQLLLESFKESMNLFATERSMETCLQSLNLSIQLASIRSTLMELYKSYSRILEKEVSRLRNICQDKSDETDPMKK